MNTVSTTISEHFHIQNVTIRIIREIFSFALFSDAEKFEFQM